MFTDPLAVTFDGSAKSLPRVAVTGSSSRYRTADGEFEFSISNKQVRKDGSREIAVSLSRSLPDPTPTNVFDDFRKITNAFGIVYRVDLTKANSSVDLPLLRTALLAFVDASTNNSRILGGEK